MVFGSYISFEKNQKPQNYSNSSLADSTLKLDKVFTSFVRIIEKSTEEEDLTRRYRRKALNLRAVLPTTQQNGVADRENRTVIKSALCLMHMKKLSLELWAEAISCAVYTLSHVKNYSHDHV